MGCFDDFDYKSYSLQGVACKLLGLEEKEVKPKITINKQKSTVSNKKYVCIATQSTAQCKYWNNPTGWQDVVDYLKNKGYEVRLLSKEENGYMGNTHPTGITLQPTGSIEKLIKSLFIIKVLILKELDLQKFLLVLTN